MTVSFEEIESAQDFIFPTWDSTALSVERAAQKVQAICEKIWNLATTPFVAIQNTIRSSLGNAIRDHIFFPLTPHLHCDQMKLETKYYADFWDLNAPLDPNLTDHRAIKEHFSVRDEIFSVAADDKQYAITCRIIESKTLTPDSSQRYQFLFLPGNLTTIGNNIIGAYPFLSSYLSLSKENQNLPPARFITITQYDISQLEGGTIESDYKPKSLDLVGEILEKTLAEVQRKYGQADQLLAHSIGCVFLSAALKYLSPSSTPKNMAFHCGPSSLEEVGKNFWFGQTICKIAQLTGWGVNTAREITNFRKYFAPKELSLMISGVKQDYYFAGDANLCISPQMKALQRENLAEILVFDPPMQLFHDRAHHNLPTDFLVPNYLHPECDPGILEEEEHLARALIRKSLDIT